MIGLIILLFLLIPAAFYIGWRCRYPDSVHETESGMCNEQLWYCIGFEEAKLNRPRQVLKDAAQAELEHMLSERSKVFEGQRIKA